MTAGRKVVRPSSTTVIYYLAHALVVAIGAATTLIEGVVWTAIGTSLIAAGAAGSVIYVYLVRTERTREAIDIYDEFGLKNIHDRRAAQIRDEYASRLASANSQIDILGFGLKDFRRDYIGELGSLSAKAAVRILLLDASSELANQRDMEESQSPGTIAAEVREFVNQFTQLYGVGTKKLSIRLYRCIPTVNIFRIDNDLFWGPYFAGRASGNTATFRVRRGGILFDQLQQHFEEVWSKYSSPVKP